MMRSSSRFVVTSTIRSVSIPAIVVLAIAALFAGMAQAQSGTWATTGNLNIARTSPTVTLLANGEVLVVGGRNAAGTELTSAEVYNPATGLWSTTGTTATARYEHTATLLANGEVLVAGGYLGTNASGQEEFTATAELYNPSTGKFTTTGSMLQARGLAGAVLLPNGNVLVAGGLNANESVGTEAELYNPTTGKWTVTGAMPVYEAAPAVLLSSGLVLVAGSDGAETYNPSTAAWTKTGAYYYTPSGPSTAALANGDALVYGNRLVSYTSQYYSPATNTWTRSNGQTGLQTNNGPLVALSNGNVLLAGGDFIYSGKSSLKATSGLYNLSTNTWGFTGALKVAGPHTPVLLQNGKVLGVGATDVEIYTP
jgi:N-acetylneuraminic acid mutarotase